MATVVLTLPSDHLNRWIDAKAGKYGYRATIEQDGQMISNPESKSAFAKRMLIERETRETKEFEDNQQAATINTPPITIT